MALNFPSAQATWRKQQKIGLAQVLALKGEEKRREENRRREHNQNQNWITTAYFIFYPWRVASETPSLNSSQLSPLVLKWKTKHGSRENDNGFMFIGSMQL